MKILCFVFNWKGQYNNALHLEKTLSPLVHNLVVINSDDEHQHDHWTNIGNDCYFSDQFKAALACASKEEYDVLLHVQADASYSNWEEIIAAAKEAYEKHNWGVYAPNVDDTFYVSERTDVMPFDGNLKIVATTDNTCWFIKRQIIEMISTSLYLMEDNQLGWGWDLLICGYAHLNKMPVLRDYSYTISHPKSTGYKKEQAEAEMFEMFHRAPKNLLEVMIDMKSRPKALSKYHPSNVFYYST